MKRIVSKIGSIVVLLIISSILISCDPTEVTTHWIQTWDLSNGTRESIYCQFDDRDKHEILPGKRYEVYKTYLPYNAVKDFSIFFRENDYQTLTIYSESGEPVKIWERENAGVSGRQFWNEKDWQEIDLNEPADAQDATWVFKITASDLSE